MIKLIISIEDGKQHLSMEGGGSKSELLLVLGMLEDLKFKILNGTQDDGAEMVFAKGK